MEVAAGCERLRGAVLVALMTAGMPAAWSTTLPDLQDLEIVLPADTPHRSCFESAAERYRLPTGLLVAVAKVESAFDPRAVSDKGAMGVMQILWPGTAAHLGIERKADLFVPCVSIDAGARYLRELIGQFGVGELALAAYNMGPSRVRSSRVEELPAAGQEYVELVARAAERLLRRGPTPGAVQTGSVLTFRLPSEERARAAVAALRLRDPSLRTEVHQVGTTWILTVRWG